MASLARRLICKPPTCLHYSSGRSAPRYLLHIACIEQGAAAAVAAQKTRPTASRPCEGRRHHAIPAGRSFPCTLLPQMVHAQQQGALSKVLRLLLLLGKQGLQPCPDRVTVQPKPVEVHHARCCHRWCILDSRELLARSSRLKAALKLPTSALACSWPSGPIQLCPCWHPSAASVALTTLMVVNGLIQAWQVGRCCTCQWMTRAWGRSRLI